MGKRRDYERRRDAKAEKLRSIMMIPREWLHQLDSWKEFKEELDR